MLKHIFKFRLPQFAFLPFLMLAFCNAAFSPGPKPLDPPNSPPPNQCECGAVSFDVDIIHDRPTQKIGSTQKYDRKQETVQVSGKSESGPNAGKNPQKIAPKNLPPTKEGDKVSIGLSNFKAECPCMNGKEKAGDCFAFPLPAGEITNASVAAHVKLITEALKAINDLQAKIDEANKKIKSLKKEAAEQETTEARKKEIAKEIKKLEKELEKLNTKLEKAKSQLPSGPPSVLGGDFKHGTGTWDANGNYNAGEFPVGKTPFKHEFIIGYVCVSPACGKAAVCYKRFVVEF